MGDGSGREMTRGILAFGAYVPWRRLPRKAIADTHGWFNPALKAQAKGERAFCNWDEDTVTMAVEAARDALAGRDRSAIGALRFASTTFPFLDRLHCGIVAEALGLDPGISAIDVAATQRAATSAQRCWWVTASRSPGCSARPRAPPISSITSARSTISSTISGRSVGFAMRAICRSCRR